MADQPTSFTHDFLASELGARAALCQVMGQLREMGLADEQAGAIEIVLAEVVNNVVEHAYSDRSPGHIVIRGHLDSTALRVRVTDQGKSLPNGELPDGQPADLKGPRSGLPEGGFGWFMIRTLAKDIRYVRENGGNHLQLTFDLIPPSS